MSTDSGHCPGCSGWVSYGPTDTGYECPGLLASAPQLLDVGRLTAATTAHQHQPRDGDEQRRCWMLYIHPDGNGQCRLYNGHDGPHAFSGLDVETAATSKADPHA